MAAVSERNGERPEEEVHAYPFRLERRLTSIDSNRSTIRWTRTPRTSTARITSNEMPELHDERHARRDAHRDEEHGVLDRQQGEDLRDRLLARHHQEEADQQHRQRDADHVVADAPGALREAGADAVADDGQAEADQQRGRDVEERLDLAVDADAVDHAHQEPGDQRCAFSTMVSAAVTKSSWPARRRRAIVAATTPRSSDWSAVEADGGERAPSGPP